MHDVNDLHQQPLPALPECDQDSDGFCRTHGHDCADYRLHLHQESHESTNAEAEDDETYWCYECDQPLDGDDEHRPCRHSDDYSPSDDEIFAAYGRPGDLGPDRSLDFLDEDMIIRAPGQMPYRSGL